MPARAFRSLLPLLSRRLVPALAGLLASASIWAAPALPEPLRPVLERSLDDPRAAFALVDDAALDALDSEARFWRLLGKAALYTLLDRTSEAQRSVDEARARLGRIPTATPRHHLWLEAYAIGALFRREDSAKLIERSVELRRAALPIGDEYLLCEISVGDLFLLRETYALDEAWRVAEETERCGRKLGQLHIETSALIAMGSMASSLSGKAPAERYFERALEVLGGQPARFQRGWIEWEMGNTLARLGQPERAARAFETSLALNREIAEPTGVAITTLDLAALRLAQNEPQRVIELVRGALPALQEGDAPVRLATAHGLVIEALARLKKAEVLQEIEKARLLERAVLPAPDRARLLQRMAEGYASQGMHAQAYAELRRANEAAQQGQQSVRDIGPARDFYCGALGWRGWFDGRIGLTCNNMGVPLSQVATQQQDVIICASGQDAAGLWHYGQVELVGWPGLGGHDFAARAVPPNLGVLALRIPVEDLDARLGALEARGVATFSRPVTVTLEPWGRVRIAGVRTPDGVLIEFYQPLT
jgi:tetratricopeptide (TPR) repeat protein